MYNTISGSSQISADNSNKSAWKSKKSRKKSGMRVMTISKDPELYLKMKNRQWSQSKLREEPEKTVRVK
jgi:hypothetical protein